MQAMFLSYLILFNIQDFLPQSMVFIPADVISGA